MIVASGEDFAVMRGTRPVGSARWDDVVRVRAYKRDDLTVDTICLDIEVRDGGRWSLNEEAPGWEDFLEAAERALPGMRPFATWFASVSRPPFAASEMVVFERDAAAP